MNKMRYLPMRRSKLVGTEGPGSLVISPEGETAVVGALDLWFKDFSGNKAKHVEEFAVNEPRLKSILKVDKFYRPPEFRKSSENTLEVVPNSNLVMPLMRFPRWHYCTFCKSLRKLELDQTSIYLDCSQCETKRYFKQVPFVVICEHGHLSDFPWDKWVHGEINSSCTGNLRIGMSGGTTLDSWIIECNGCGNRRGLKGVTASHNGEEKTSVLGETLNKVGSTKYTCEGERPWCGEEKEECSAAPVAILRNSISVYMAKKISALAIPGDYSENVDLIVSKIQSPAKYLARVNLNIIDGFDNKVKYLKNNLRFELNEEVSDHDIREALMYIEAGEEYEYTDEDLEKPGMLIKEKEFEKLTSKVNSNELRVEPEWINGSAIANDNYYKPYLERLSRVLKLKETTALYGFDRKEYRNNDDYSNYYPSLFKDYESLKEKWLPVSEVYGEGIFLQMNQRKIEEWENTIEVKEYFERYIQRVSHIEHRDETILTPKNIMMHTLSHFLIEEFANVCGYNRSAIRERLYLSEGQTGILIYISGGDSEGTLGGLVRLGLQEKFFHILDKAKNNAEWCSSDPVCTELGQSQGQGVNDLNGAACYNCSHIPETSCEYWNLYLDRSLLIDSKIGYFKD
ncbi:DrmB family protein [Guptibacillus hwajinpoensis]|uniref:DNA-directed RNA polymerase subunit RPC12/RpoP n=1 Tax=Guptibacillus hwajinpoensis TaxID=208199 RepID=A0ABU0JVF4_9BACL|nr:DrmB family protein [Alkalihalobacillus hemicentroti]MDQ0481082.1 DNA-directed RNA polymerase subunit RPC12/RpoP [Alkalihalobacillus hemicentroti]